MKWKRKSEPQKSKEQKQHEHIKKVAAELRRNRLLLGRRGNVSSDRETAEEIVKSDLRTVLFVINRPLIGLEKRILEPFSKHLKQSAAFDIIDRLSPALEAIGVLLIPFVLYLATQAYEQQREAQENERLQQETVQNYIAQLSDIFLNVDGDLRSDENQRIRTIATAATITLFRDPNLDGDRKGQVVEFLSQMDLVQVSESSDESGEDKSIENQWSIINLSGADLEGVDVSEIDFRGADLSGVDFRGADLSEANLNGVNLSGADLSGANLRGANLRGANFTGVSISEANFFSADLSGADFRSTTELNFDSSGNIASRTYKAGPYFSGVIFQFANLEGAYFESIDFNGVSFARARFDKALFLGTDFREATELEQEQFLGDKLPLLCNSPLPDNIKIDQNRDCDQIAAVLYERHPDDFSTLQEAEEFVNSVKRETWDDLN